MSPIIHVNQTDSTALDLYFRYSEPQLKHLNEPELGYFLSESPRVIMRALAAGYEPVSILVSEEETAESQTAELLERCADVPAYTGPFEELKKRLGFPMLRGALCAMRRREEQPPEAILAGAKRIAILENVTNPTNVGAIFRSAAALHMDAVLLTPSCSDPLYRRSIRVSMGTIFQVPWAIFGKLPDDWPDQGMRLLREQGFRTAAMALSDQSVRLDAPELLEPEKLAIVLGAEGDGLAQETIAACDWTVKIPMSHGVDSLNVAAASAVAFWQLGRR